MSVALRDVLGTCCVSAFDLWTHGCFDRPHHASRAAHTHLACGRGDTASKSASLLVVEATGGGSQCFLQCCSGTCLSPDSSLTTPLIDEKAAETSRKRDSFALLCCSVNAVSDAAFLIQNMSPWSPPTQTHHGINMFKSMPCIVRTRNR